MSIKPPRVYLPTQVSLVNSKSSSSKKTHESVNTPDSGKSSKPNLDTVAVKKKSLNSSESAKKVSRLSRSKKHTEISSLVVPREMDKATGATEIKEKKHEYDNLAHNNSYFGIGVTKPFDFSDDLFEEDDHSSLLTPDSSFAQNMDRLFDQLQASMTPISRHPNLVDNNEAVSVKILESKSQKN